MYTLFEKQTKREGEYSIFKQPSLNVPRATAAYVTFASFGMRKFERTKVGSRKRQRGLANWNYTCCD